MSKNRQNTENNLLGKKKSMKIMLSIKSRETKYLQGPKLSSMGCKM